jgi:peptide/nickel transport system substrate-binding protein
VDERSPPDAIRAFLIADVRGYTAFTQTYGNEAAARLALRFAELVHEVVADRSSEGVQLRGDEALCVFTSPRAAIRTAVELQQRFADEIRANPSLPLLVGVGIDVGEAVAVEPGFRGSALNLAARLCAVAKPGEVLISEATAHLASPIDGMLYLDRGRVAMKGIAEPVRMMQVQFPLDMPEVETAHHRRRPWRVIGAGAVAASVACGLALFVLHIEDSATGAALPANTVGMLGDGGVEGDAVVLPAHGRPGDIAAAQGMLWVTDTVNGRLLRVDPESRTTAPIEVGQSPLGVAAGGGFVWVVNGGDRTVSQVNAEAAEVVGDPIQVGNGATRAAFGEGSLWVVNTFDLTLSRIDPDAARVTKTIPLGVPPTDVAVGEGAVWVTSESTGTLLRIDPAAGRVAETIAVGNGPTSVTTGGGAVWVANPPDRTVTRVDTHSLEVAKVALQVPPTTLAWAGGTLWVGDATSSMLRLDQSGHTAGQFDVGSPPTDSVTVGDQVWVATTAGPEAHRGGALRVVLDGGFDSLDPGYSYDPASWQALILLYDGLVGFRRSPDAAGATLVPDLALRLPEPSDGGRTYAFTLRPGMRYSTGAPVLPSDFREALERQFGTGSAGEFLIGRTLRGSERCVAHPANRCDLSAGVVADDQAGTITFHLREPNPDFLSLLALPFGMVVPAGQPPVTATGAPPPGTGPYVVKTYVPGKRLALTRNPHFKLWSADAQPEGYPDSIDWRLGVDADTQVDEVIAGGADVATADVPPEALKHVLTRYPTQTHSYTPAFTYYYFMNTQAPPFDDVRVRRALNYAADRAEIVRLVGGDNVASITCQTFPPNLPGYEQYCPYTASPGPGGTGPWTGPDMPRARQLIDDSGTAGMKVTLDRPVGATDPNLQPAPAAYIAGLLRSLGYAVAIKDLPLDEYFTVINKADSTQIGPTGWIPDFQTPSGFFNRAWSCDNLAPGSADNANPSAFCDPAIDRKADRARSLQARNPAAANKLWAQVDRMFTDQAPWLALVNPRGTDLVSARVGNYQRHLQWGVLLDQLWVV